MLKYLMHKFALTEQGAKDFIKTMIMNVLSNIALMVPVWLLYILVDDLLGDGIPTSHYYLFTFGSLGIIIALGLIYYVQYHCSYFLTYKESGKKAEKEGLLWRKGLENCPCHSSHTKI